MLFGQLLWPAVMIIVPLFLPCIAPIRWRPFSVVTHAIPLFFPKSWPRGERLAESRQNFGLWLCRCSSVVNLGAHNHCKESGSKKKLMFNKNILGASIYVSEQEGSPKKNKPK